MATPYSSICGAAATGYNDAKLPPMNRLRNHPSPYLRQHADNPAHWQPWDAAALAQARDEDKPILLSIGYAACHWCHVMARESFEDAETAALMNAHFVNIKVDREERPDLDKIYQSAHYIFTRRSGGWPLTMFLAPDGKPFFGGTYFPKTARPGLSHLPTFAQVLNKVADAWRHRREQINEQNDEVVRILQQLDAFAAPPNLTLSDAPIQTALANFAQLFDADDGGLGGAPKFPHPVELAFCLDAAFRADDAKLKQRVEQSLRAIAAGGLTDHVGGGFFRYCVDARWRIPHFEKMLYDNGLLIALFADAAVAFGNDEFRRVAIAAANWLLDAMRDANGCFYSSLDADSDGGEGGFYLWDKDELRSLLSADSFALLSARFDFDSDTVEGKYHLFHRADAPPLADMSDDERAMLADALQTLRAARARRRPPATDDKILPAWNALAIKALARVGRLFNHPAATRIMRDITTAAQVSPDTTHPMARARDIAPSDSDDNNTMPALAQSESEQHQQTRAAAVKADYPHAIGGDDAAALVSLATAHRMARARGASDSTGGFLDDCAFLLDAALELLRVRFCARTLALAESLAADLIANYYDKAGGGFFFSPAGGEVLIRRLKTPDDNATPSGNGIAADALLRLFALTGNPQYRDCAEHALRAFYDNLREHGSGSASLLVALQRYITAPTVIYLTGDAAQCRARQRQLEQTHRPNIIVYSLPAAAPDAAGDGETGGAGAKRNIGGGAAETSLPSTLIKPIPAEGVFAHICADGVCQPPILIPPDLPPTQLPQHLAL